MKESLQQINHQGHILGGLPSVENKDKIAQKPDDVGEAPVNFNS